MIHTHRYADVYTDEVDSAECFRSVGEWIDRLLERSVDHKGLYILYLQDVDMWSKIPEVFNALSRRRYGAML